VLAASRATQSGKVVDGGREKNFPGPDPERHAGLIAEDEHALIA
jgi:hypothetical protein